ncbi:MAG: AAA family ATPase [Treponemataceae bacterium]
MRKIGYKEAGFSFSSSKIDKLKKITIDTEIIGQKRAVEAIKMGLKLKAPGFNIFVMGGSGTGRRTTVTELAKKLKPDYKDLTDIAYVYNFKKQLEPDAIFFPAGEGAEFRSKLKQAIGKIVSTGASLVRSESYLTSVNRIINESNAHETELLINFEAKTKAAGFKLVQVKQEGAPNSFDLTPIYEGVETNFLELRDLVEQKKLLSKDFDTIKENYYKCFESMNGLFDAIQINQEKTQEKLEKLLQDSVKPIISKNLKPIFDKAKTFEKKFKPDEKNLYEKIITFLKNIKTDLENKAFTFTHNFKNHNQKKKFLSKYDINLICENSIEKDYLITENLPTFSNLFGSIESSSTQEPSVIDAHMRISPGAVHKAFGGFLVLRFSDLIADEDSYFYLKRVLQSGKIEIQTSPSSNIPAGMFKPVPIPANFKVILIGDENTYDVVYQADGDFSKLFKICAEFSPVMLRNEENEAAFVALVERIAKKHKIKKIDNSGYASLLAFACKLSGSRKFISTRFASISDVLLQASLIAEEISAPSINEEVITKTLARQRFFSSLPEQEYLEELKCGIVFLSVEGKKIGSVNGLAVQERGYFSFGVPEVITAQSSPGENGVINIETEVGFSGEIYDKAHLIISSLLKNTYAKDIKLSVDASICFQQSYGMIEGDSASCAEFLVLVSSIAQIPLRQDLAITGSLNQHGDVQPIGGVSEKVEGFFNACKILGFTGTQGVVIPEANVQDLFLSDEVLQAIKDGIFTIYSVEKIDEVVSIFTETKASVISEAIKTRLGQFNRVMTKLVSIES